MALFDDLLVRSVNNLPHLHYKGRWVYNWYSNFAPGERKIEFDGMTFETVEQAFVAAKTKDREIRKLVVGLDPTSAKRYGRNNTQGCKQIRDFPPFVLRKDWDHINLAAMDNFVRQKFSKDTRELDMLVKLQLPIVEWTNWNDPRWGIDVNSRKGRNGLGFLLSLIVREYMEYGTVQPGVDEDGWFEEQERLIRVINATWPDDVLDRPIPEVFQESPEVSE